MAKEEIEIEEKDPVAEKAEAIGKDLGIEKDEAPDYDIQEEGDERIAKERNPEKPLAESTIINRENRKKRKEKLNIKFEQKNAIIEEQAARIAQLERRQNEIDGRLQGVNRAEIDRAWNETQATLANAKKDYEASFAEGDGAKNVAALAAMSDANDRLKKLRELAEHADKKPVQEVAAAPVKETKLLSKRVEWESRNEWFNPASRDTGSQMAIAIAGAIANEGFDPTTDDYWDELDDRMSKFIPEKIKAKEVSDDDDYEEDIVEKPKRRTSPPVNGASNRGDIKGKKAIRLPTEYINMLKANGKWDNEKVRNRILADRERIIKESNQ